MSNSDDDDEYDFFESSLESLFGQRQSASGKPGQKCQLELPGGRDGASTILNYRIPTNQSSSNNRLFAHYQWDAGVQLAKIIHDTTTDNTDSKLVASTSKVQIRNKNVLELGAGTGLPSLVSALGGASKVLITDYPDEGIIAAIRENIGLCKVEKVASARGLDWSDTTQIDRVLQGSPYSKGYDLILCADVLWLSSSHAALLETIQKLLMKTNSSRVLLLSGFHTGRRALVSFFRRAAEAGLCSDWEQQGGGVFEYNVITQTARPWSGRKAFAMTQQNSNRMADEEGQEDEEEDNMDDYTERTKWLLFVSLRWSSFKDS